MAEYSTPGVYVREISTFPPSVAEVSTAIPAFIGYTEKGRAAAEGPQVSRINTLLDYETQFGKAQPRNYTVTASQDSKTQIWRIDDLERSVSDTKNFLLHYALTLYFKNGGGSCYIISIGNYDDPLDKEHFTAGLGALEKEDEPTLIVAPDALGLGNTDYYALCQEILSQCAKLGDRFAILDVPDGSSQEEPFKDFRDGIQMANLKYGAAYTPHLQTALSYRYEESDVTVTISSARDPNTQPEGSGEWEKAFGDKGILISYEGSEGDEPKAKITAESAVGFEVTEAPKVLIISNTARKTGLDVETAWNEWSNTPDNKTNGYSISKNDDGLGSVTATTGNDGEALVKTNSPPEDSHKWEKAFGDKGILISYEGSENDEPKAKITAESAVGFEVTEDPKVLIISNTAGKTGLDVETAWNEWSNTPDNKTNGYSISKIDDGSGSVTATTGNDGEALNKIPSGDEGSSASDDHKMSELKENKTSLYNQLRTKLNEQRVILPPSPAIAGVYARVDRNRGVWKAPANESLLSVIAPMRKITNEEQGILNIDPNNTGKSINAIRAFTGKGTLVWGARTLAGDDNEWRYIPVRRLFNMIEESSQKSTAFAVFEPNDATTWLKVKAMIESFLYSLWERGALAGSTPEAAYFVNVGLGKTMTQQDILDGLMNVEIGVAAVRPAEFIILKFSHKLQEA